MADKYVWISDFHHNGRVWDIVTPEQRTIGSPFWVRDDGRKIASGPFPSGEDARQWIRDHA